MIDSCPFCEELEIGSLVLHDNNFGNRILFATRNFCVLPALGPMVEGYLLIISKQHYIGISEIPAQLYPELEAVQQKVRNILTQVYRPPFFFEHGPIGRSKRGGCCIEHTHLHAVPAKIDIVDHLSKHFHAAQIHTYAEVKRQFVAGIPYFFVETSTGTRFLFQVPHPVPTQYLRRLIANEIGKPNIWDWHTHPDLDLMKQTKAKLQEYFAEPTILQNCC